MSSATSWFGGLRPLAAVAYALVASSLVFALAGCSDRAAPGGADVRVEHLGDRTRIVGREATVEIAHAPFRISVSDRDGAVLASQTATGGLFFERSGGRFDLRSVDSESDVEGGVALDVSTSEEDPLAGVSAPASVTVRFASARTVEVVFAPAAPTSVVALGARWDSRSDEAIYGLTERLRDAPPFAPGTIDIPVDDVRPPEVGSLNRRGETVAMFVTPTFSLYAPFYQSSRGYGLAVQGTMPGAFDVASTESDVLSFRFETGTRPENQRLAFDLYVGPEYATILDEYTARFGRPFVPPDWAFLNWRWRGELEVADPAVLDGTPVNAEFAEDVSMFDDLGIPPGVYLFDRPVFPGNYGFARFAWDETRLPNPGAMLAALDRRGYRTMIWSSTWTCGSEPGDNGLEAQARGFLAPGSAGPPSCADVGGTSFILDVTNADAREWWKEKVRDFVAAWGIDGIKLDRGEEHIPSAASDLWADGRTGREVHNDYVNIQTKLHNEALREAHPDGDFVLFTRSGYAGAQQWAVVWGGDIPGSELFGGGPGTDLGLRSAIISQQRAAFMGFPIWGSDTGGYYEFKDRDVFARWIEFSAFSGIMEIGGVGPHAPWTMPTEPSYDAEMIEIYRRYTVLRSALQPYVVAAAREAGESGMPIVRPMPFADRSDPALRDLWDEYLFGPDLLVAPVWRIGERARSVYFPRGRWRSYWNASEVHQGGTTATVEAPLDVIPVFVRDGAEVPGP
ncbi:MAG TPA: TIM-barrel domain-containing protein [Candidatus Binatia bacterium]|nr:TIM-barrel domain-containing protein [Candidatus Binatia bacterium]